MKRLISLFASLALLLGAVPASVTAAPAWCGDADGDGGIDLVDASLILKSIALWEVEVGPLADFDGDGGVDLTDAALVLKYIAKWNVAPDSLLEAQYGVTEVDFEIPAPDPSEMETVSGSEFGFDTEAADNSGAWAAAVSYLREHPGTVLQIETGVYRMKAGVSFTGLRNCLIDGGGSTFLFSAMSFFGVGDCELFEIRNFTMDWDYETVGYPTTSVVRIGEVRETEDTDICEVDYEFFLVDDASYAVNISWDSMMHMDPDALTVGMVGALTDIFNLGVFHKGFELTAPNVVTATLDSSSYAAHVDRLIPGDVWLLKHFNYSPPAFSQSSGTNVTYRDITVHSGPGGGIYLGGKDTHHVRIDGVNVTLNPENADHIRMSATADALNFKNTGGYIIVENCDIGYQGDDCLNIHSTPGVVEDAYDDVLDMIVRNGNNFYVGCEVGFYRASDFSEHEFTATVTGYELYQNDTYGQHYYMILDREVPEDIVENWIVYNKSSNGENYIIRNNYFHENRARGVLLGSPNGLVENNRFYRNQLSAINMGIDHGDQWIEGTGVHNMIIRNNVFEECNLTGSGACINIHAGSIYGTGGLILGECFRNILISGNTFINYKAEILAARSVTGLSVINNRIENPDEIVSATNPETVFAFRGEIFLQGFQIKDATVIHNQWVASPYISEKVTGLKVAASELRDTEITAYGNIIIP